MQSNYNILIMGASYGSLLATKLLLAGHTAKLICLPAEAELINNEGARVRVPVKGRDGLVEIDSRKLPGKLSAGGPCVQKDGMRPIKDAVHADIEASRSVYDWVVKLCVSLGAAEKDLVPYEKYANAALSLQSPSSAARALAAGAPLIERTDRLVQTIAAQKGMRNDVVDQTVLLVDGWLERNRKKAA